MLLGACVGGACSSSPQPPTGATPTSGEKVEGQRAAEIPQIGLSRLSSPRGTSGAGRRDVFAGQAAVPLPVATPASAPSAPTAPPSGELGAPGAPPATGAQSAVARSALAGVRCIGLVERRDGLKAAVFTTDRGEVLAGRVGEIVGGRLKVLAIGLESVDVQELGSDRTTRLPLRGN
jgi:hypothetical protein